MKRTKIIKLYEDPAQFADQEITVMGWARNLRDQKSFGFIELNDGSAFKPLQVVFERETLDLPDYQGTSVINYTEVEVPYTRIHEFKHYHPEGLLNGTWGFNAKKTVIMREYPATWKPGDEPYYPVDCEESRTLLSKYQDAARKYPNLVIGGRLGGYKYYDMDQSIAAALETVAGFLK